MKGFWNDWNWQEYTLTLIVGIFLFVEMSLFSQFGSLPSPIYGGDVYYHFGVINHIANGGSPLMNSQFLGEYAHYPWIFHLIVATMSIFFGVSTLTTTIYSPLLTTLLGAIISWQLGKRVFESKTFALLFAIYWTTWQIPHAAASPFAELVIWPLFVLLATYCKGIWSRIFAGIALGLCGLAQVVTWIGAFMYLGLLMISRTAFIHVKNEGGKWKVNTQDWMGTIISQIKWILPIIIVGLPIGLLYWGPGIFVYHGVTPNRWADYVAAGDVVTFEAVFGMIQHLFFFTHNIATLLISVISALGLYWATQKHPRFEAITITFFVAAIGFLHPIITLPLSGTSIGYYAFGYIFDLAKPLLFVCAIYLIYRSVGPTIKPIVYLAGILIVCANAYFIYTDYDSDIWTNAGRSANPMFVMADQIKAEAGDDDIFLVGHEETGFALNAITGKKVAIARRTHTSPFVDINRRVADTAIMLYGNNSETIKELLDKYSARYLYEDHYGAEQQYSCMQNFENLPGNPDASMQCLRTTPAYADYLTENGITSLKIHARLDPASNVAPQFDMLAIKPGNYSYIGKKLKVLKTNEIQGQLIQRWSEIQ